MHGYLQTLDGDRFDGEIEVSDYTWTCAAARAYGQGRISLGRDHEILDTPAITDLQGVMLGLSHDLLGNWPAVQIGAMGHDERSWHLTGFQIGALLKELTVPPTPGDAAAYTNLPAGVIAKEALRLALAEAPPGVPLYPGFFSEAPPLVESFRFQDQSLDAIFGQLMEVSGQEYQISETGRVDWVAPVGEGYATVLTEGYDFALVSYDPQAMPLRRVILTDQRGEVVTLDAPEHARTIAARVLRERVDTASTDETMVIAQGLLNAGRVVPQVFEIDLLPKGGAITITLPGSPGTLYGEGLYGAGVYGGGGWDDFTASYPIVDAPHWSGIREGDFVRIIAPGANLRGASPLCRVLSRTFGDAHLVPRLRLVSVPQWTAATVPSAAVAPRSSLLPAQTMERRLLDLGLSRGGAVDTARLRSKLDDTQVPGFISRDATLSDHEARIAALESA